MNAAYLERIDPSRNMARYYRLSLAPTLFGQWTLVREWGSIGSPGTLREDWFGTEAEAESARIRLALQKVRRGYRMPGAADPAMLALGDKDGPICDRR